MDAGRRAFVLDTQSLAFDLEVDGGRQLRDLVITNTGDHPLTQGVARLFDAGVEFSLDAGCASLGLDASCTVTVGFAPRAVATLTGVVGISYAGAPTQDVSLSAVAFATARVSLQPGGGLGALGFDGGWCPSGCELRVRVPADVVVTWTADAGAGLVQWDLPCSGSQADTCATRVLRDTTFAASFSRLNLVFPTRTAVVPGPNMAVPSLINLCASEAFALGITGTFGLTLRTATDAGFLDPTKRGFVRADGRPVADTTEDLLFGRHLYPPNRYLDGGVFILSAWSGWTHAGGPGESCDGWSNPNAAGGTFGVPGSSGARFLAAGNDFDCTQSRPVLCVQQDFTARPAPQRPPAGHRRAFLSSGAVLGNVPTSTANFLCQGEASAADLSSPSSFRALRGLGDAGVALDGGWYRLDGVQWTTARSATLPAPVGLLTLSSLDVLVDGGRLPLAADAGVWTGTVLDCQGWTAPGGNGTRARAFDALLTEAFGGPSSPWPCNQAARLYCVEE